MIPPVTIRGEAIMSDHVPNDVREHIARAVREGFDGEEDIVERAAEDAEDERGGGPGAGTGQVTPERLAPHRAEQAGCPPPPDCDRLDAAFAAMQRRGVIARQNFSCCSNCGHGEMWGEMRSAAPNC